MPQIALHGRWPDRMSMVEDKIWESLFTVVFKEKVSSNIRKACLDLFSLLLLGEELLVPPMLSHTHHRFPHNLLPHHQQPTLHHTSRRHWGQAWWRPLTPCSFSFWKQILSADRQDLTCSWRASCLANYLLPQEWEQQGSRQLQTGQLLPQPCVEVLWWVYPLQIPGIS